MDISPVTSLSSLQNIFATTRAQRVVFSLITPAQISSTSVDISGPGKLLSAASILDRAIVSPVGTDSISLNTVVAATQIFVDAFNSFLQSSSLTNSSGEYLGGLFIQSLNAQSVTANGQSILAGLSTVGISYQAPDSQTATGGMTLNLSQLQSAYTTDRAGTIALLSRSTQAIGRFAASFTSAFVQMDLLAQLSASLLSSAASNRSFTSNASLASTLLSQPAVSGGSATTAGATIAGTTTPAGIASTTAGDTTTGTTPVTITTTSPAIGAETTGVVSTTAAVAATTGIVNTTATGAATTGAVNTTPSATIVAGTITPVSSANTGISSLAGSEAMPISGTLIPAAAGIGQAASGPSVMSDLAQRMPVSGLTEAVPVVNTDSLTAAVLPATTQSEALTAFPVETVSYPAPNTIIDASNPAVAAAIAAYHMSDAAFDGEWPRNTGLAPPEVNYIEIQPVVEVHPVKLDISA